MSMIGKTLGNFEITSQLGRGGMGEVYQAKDRKLGRHVAIKVLPEEFARDADRVARFQREAKLLASLNHPNIAAIHGLEESNGTNFLVLELVEGETLADMIKAGPVPVEEALKLALQIAEALEAAHEKGVIHRDLKPANVKVTPEGKVKVLDFGLAKAFAGEQAEMNLSNSPTLSEAATLQGIILGTAAYMSPEQAKGKTVDKRADIWAFGAVLFEMLTGRQLFSGETVTETLAAVLTREPELENIPEKTRRLLHSCLQKDPKRRLADISDSRFLLEEVTESVPVKRPLLWICSTAVLMVAFIVVLLIYLPEKMAPSPVNPMRFQIPPTVRLAPEGSFAVSPDGQFLAFAAINSDGTKSLWIRALDSLEAKPLFGTEAATLFPFFWSPDSRFIAFHAGGKLKKIDIRGGPAQTICDLSSDVVGGSWNRNDVIILGSGTTAGEGLKRVSATGGAVSVLSKPDSARQIIDHFFPTFLPDGRHFLYWQSSQRPENIGLYIGSLDSKPEEQGAKKVLAANFQPVYIPAQNSGPGHLLFLRDLTLMDQQFDDKRLELIGEPVPVVEKVGSYMAFGFFSASTNGLLIYRSGNAVQVIQGMWFDRQGKSLGVMGESGVGLDGLSLSPDSDKAAISLVKMNQGFASTDLWLVDSARATNTRFTFGQGNNIFPVWSPDGSKIIFASDREGVWNLYQKLVSGVKDEELLLKSNNPKYPSSWSGDGRFLLYAEVDPKTKSDLKIMPLEGDRKPVPFLQTEFNESYGRFSPDMHWIAYQSDESGGNEIYVRGFSNSQGAPLETSGKWQVSVGGGVAPRWRKDGKELYYRAPDGKVMVVNVTTDTVFRLGTPKTLFPAPPNNSHIWDVTADGDRFLISTAVTEETSLPFNVILNWQAGLKK
jgi:eukaryotic-like serine/threonine-protein kinase